MKSKPYLLLYACMYVLFSSAAVRGGHRRGTMDWSHLGPRPENAVSVLPARYFHKGIMGTSVYGSRFDLRDDGHVSSVKDQGPFGCCWCFSSLGALESFIFRRKGGCDVDFSERNMALFAGRDYEPKYDRTGFGLIDQGGEISLADAYLLRWAGPVDEADDPYPVCATNSLEGQLSDEQLRFFTDTLGYPADFVSLHLLSSFSLDKWYEIDREAELAGYGSSYHTHFVTIAKAVDWTGRLVNVPHIRRELVPDDVFADCDTRQGPWNVNWHVQGTWQLPPRNGPLDNDTIKHAVMENGGVASSYFFSPEYESMSDTATYGMCVYYCPLKDVLPSHEVVIVGWDDDFPRENFPPGLRPSGNGAFLAKNSWGESGIGGGYFWMSYYDGCLATGEDGTSRAFSRVDSPDEGYGIVHSYDYLGLGSGMGYGKTTATAANMFVASGPESLRAVGTYLLQWNTKYTVSIYAGCAAGKPTSGVLVHTQKGTREFPGYETIELDAPVPISKGDRYSVVVTLTTPGFGRPVPVQIDDSAGARYSRKNCSYLQGTNGSWVDIVAGYNPKKAFSGNNSPKTFCCKVYADKRETQAFDGDAKGVYSITLSDGSVLTVTAEAASGGKSSVSAKIVKGTKTMQTFAARSVSVSDGAVILRGSGGRMLRLSISGSEDGGNSAVAELGANAVMQLETVAPNVTAYDFGDFRVGVAASGVPSFVNATGRAVTWTASGLPAGVGINSKTGALTGSPAKAVSSVKTAKVVATAAGGGSDAFSFKYVVKAMDSWAAGTKTGGGDVGALSFSVGSTGKISGKIMAGGSIWTFSSSCFGKYSETTDGGIYFWSGTAKSGKNALPVSFAVYLSKITDCTSDATESSVAVADCDAASLGKATAYASMWGKKPYSSYATVLAAAPTLRLSAADLECLGAGETITLKFGRKGAVVASGAFRSVSGGKTVKFSKTFSTTLLPVSSESDGAFRAQSFAYFAPDSKRGFAGFATRIRLLWDNFFFRSR